MITDDQWKSLVYLQPSDFKNPDGLDFSIVQALDNFIHTVGSRPIFLSDWRPYDPENPNSRHYYGDAIDTTWPGRDPLQIRQQAIDSRLFSGVGIYYNDAGVASFHFDTRPNRTKEDPALWGGLITHPYSPQVGDHVRKTDYTTAQAVVDVIKKNGASAVLILFVSGYMISKISSQ